MQTASFRREHTTLTSLGSRQQPGAHALETHRGVTIRSHTSLGCGQEDPGSTIQVKLAWRHTKVQ